MPLLRYFTLTVILGFLLIGIQEKIPQAPLLDQVSFSFNERFPSFNADHIRTLSFGYPRLFSTLLWLRFLQETPVKKVPENQLSWIYFDLNTILEIDPEFYPAVKSGGLFLSVITEDKIGAEKLLLKGIKLFPDRWYTYFLLGYHYLYEMKDEIKAAAIYRAGALLPNANFLLSVIAVTLTTRTTTNKIGLSLLHHLISETKDPIVRKKLVEKLNSLPQDLKNE